MANILINAGHRVGIDNGGSHGTQTEAKTNVNVAMACAKRLRERGYNVLLTHENPVAKNLKASDLLLWANKQNFDYCISIHQNDAESENAEGSEVLWNGTDEVAEVMALFIQEGLVKLGAKDRGVKARKDLAMLKIKKCHCVLTEGAFLTAKDYGRINTVAEQQAQGIAIADGLLKAITTLRKG